TIETSGVLEVELAITTGASTRPTSHRPQLLLERLACAFPRLRHIRADMGYHGRAVEWIKVPLGWPVRRSLNACRSGGATPSTANPQCLGGRHCRGGGSSGALSLGSDATAG